MLAVSLRWGTAALLPVNLAVTSYSSFSICGCSSMDLYVQFIFVSGQGEPVVLPGPDPGFRGVTSA